MSYKEAVATLLSMLKREVGMDLWMVTRVNGDDFIVLQNIDSNYDMVPNDIFNFSAAAGHVMLNHRVPNIVAEAAELDLHKQGVMAHALPVGAYIGFPLKTESGELFGTLCAIDPSAKNMLIHKHNDFIATIATAIECLLIQQKGLIDKQRMIDNYYYPLASDSLTGALNRRGWDDVLIKEKFRAQQLGNNIGVGIVNISRFCELNDDRHSYANECKLKLIAMTLMRSMRSGDTIARIGDLEFGLLLPDCNKAEITEFESLLRTRFKQQHISVDADFTIYGHTEDLQIHVDLSRKRIERTSCAEYAVLMS